MGNEDLDYWFEASRSNDMLYIKNIYRLNVKITL
jgi:hypothetical protein